MSAMSRGLLPNYLPQSCQTLKSAHGTLQPLATGSLSEVYFMVVTGCNGEERTFLAGRLVLLAPIIEVPR